MSIVTLLFDIDHKQWWPGGHQTLGFGMNLHSHSVVVHRIYDRILYYFKFCSVFNCPQTNSLYVYFIILPPSSQDAPLLIILIRSNFDTVKFCILCQEWNPLPLLFPCIPQSVGNILPIQHTMFMFQIMYIFSFKKQLSVLQV